MANPWLALAGIAAGAVALYYYVSGEETETATTGDGNGNGEDPGNGAQDPGFDPTPPDPEVPDPEPPGGIMQPPGPPAPEPDEPAVGWHAILSEVLAPQNVPHTTRAMAALESVKDAAAAQPAGTWNTAVRLALIQVFPQNTWGGLLSGWKADARAYMIQQLDMVSDRSHWPPGDDSREAARVFWLQSSAAIIECQPYKGDDIAFVSCICDTMFPGSDWPAAGTTGFPWEKETWTRASFKAGVV